MSKDRTSTSSGANARQVGGSHYQDATGLCPNCGEAIQHWDLFAKMPYLPAQVCRYVLRFLGKNGQQDLKKARHFLDKTEEVYYPKRCSGYPTCDGDLVAIPHSPTCPLYIPLSPRVVTFPGFRLHETVRCEHWSDGVHILNAAGACRCGRTYEVRELKHENPSEPPVKGDPKGEVERCDYWSDGIHILNTEGVCRCGRTLTYKLS